MRHKLLNVAAAESSTLVFSTAAGYVAKSVLREMNSRVLGLRHHSEVRRVVVFFVAVAVMDDLVIEKLTPEHLLGHLSVLVTTAVLHVSGAGAAELLCDRLPASG